MSYSMCYRNVRFAVLVIVLAGGALLSSQVSAGIELVCEGQRQESPHQPVRVNCSDRRAVIDLLGAAWRELRESGIGGTLEDMCWDSYQDARALHPAVGMNPGIASTFLMRCNMGLSYVQPR